MAGIVEESYIWSPVGSVAGCVYVNATGACRWCQEGAALSGSNCIIPADTLHYTFENDLADLSGNDYDGELVNDQYSLVGAPNAPEGNSALRLTGGYVNLPALNLGAGQWRQS